eukprot:CCRYP_004384-RA/>CCRYP_004384-RA protein AED:0.36 eAED:0.36 QI:0/-1/0/1/-1/1/1/0/380
MGKKTKKRKQIADAAISPAHAPSAVATKTSKRNPNPLQTAQQTFFNSLSNEARLHFFSPKHVTPEQRAEIWENQAELGEKLINKYAWATPDDRILKIFQHFGPIVEVGCGSNAYWAKWMNAEGGVDVVALDESLESGGKLNVGRDSGKKKSTTQNDQVTATGGLLIRCGGPSTLSTDPDIRDSGRTLFLCYPDEEEYQESDSTSEDDIDVENNIPPSKSRSMAAACLEHFTGSTIIHVGELFGDTLSLDLSPWGRSSSSEFQERLASEYHCILKMKLANNWLHVRDTLSVWKRSETCCMVYENDENEEDESAEEDQYKYVPPEEVLPTDLAAPCVVHLLQNTWSNEDKINQSDNTAACNKNNRKEVTKKPKTDVVAGSAW